MANQATDAQSTPRIRPLTRAEAARIDRAATEECGMPTLLLMENAGRGLASRAKFVMMTSKKPLAQASTLVLCGGGNNGGDGYVAARFLNSWGMKVTIMAFAPLERLRGDAAINAEIAKRSGIEIIDASNGGVTAKETPAVVIDALLGTGFSGELRPEMAAAIKFCNQLRDLGAFVIAADLPSGLDSDTGKPSEPTVRANITVTFVAPKIGFSNPLAQKYLGIVMEWDIGAPAKVLKPYQTCV